MMSSGPFGRFHAGAAAQRLELGLGQSAYRTFREIAELEITDRHAHQPQAFGAERFQHAADLAVAALVELDFDPAIALALS
jgi:hypothetical protein